MTIPRSGAWAHVITRVLSLVTALAWPLGAQATAPRIPLTRGLAFVQTLHMPEGDRESLVTVDDTSATSVKYTWRFLEVHVAGDTVRNTVHIETTTSDLTAAPRWLEVREPRDPPLHPGYTSFSFSTATYRQLAFEGSDATRSVPSRGATHSRRSSPRWASVPVRRS